MKKRILLVSVLVLIALIVVFPQITKQFQELLSGYEEVPAVSTSGRGIMNARISAFENAIPYDLQYSALEGNITQAHIHLGQSGVNGSISVWLCSNLASPPTPAGTQPCPAAPGSITGTIRPADVTNGAVNQGLAAGEFDELVRAIRAGKTYVNIHTTKFPGGEVRSQIEHGEDHTGF